MKTNWEAEFKKILTYVKELEADAEKRSGGWDNGFPDGEARACELISDEMNLVIERDEAEEAKREAQMEADRKREESWYEDYHKVEEED